MRLFFFLTFLLAIIYTPAYAEEKLPRFVSLKKSEANLRIGPGDRFPIDWVFRRKGWPFEVTDEYEHWRKVRDIDGTIGWIHKSMLVSSPRMALTKRGHQTLLYKKDKLSSKIIAILKGSVPVHIKKCKRGNSFCKVSTHDIVGYIKRSDLFGVYEDEEVKK